MKKKFLLLMALLASTVGMWANESYTWLDDLHGHWNAVHYSLDKTALAVDLGMDEADLSSSTVTIYSLKSDNTQVAPNSNYAGNGGYNGDWHGSDGYSLGGWSGTPSFYHVVNYTDFTIGMGQNPNATAWGNTFTFQLVVVKNADTSVSVTLDITYKITHQKAYNEAVAAANEALISSDYASVTGTERTALENAVNAAVTETEEGWNSAAANINAALEAFRAAVLTVTAAGSVTCTDTPLHTGYTCTYFDVSNSAIASALGLSEADFTANYSSDNSGQVIMATYDSSDAIYSTTDAGEGSFKGYWMNANGKYSGYSSGVFYFVYDPAGRIGIGQKPGSCTNGSSYTFSMLFKYGTRVAVVSITYNIERALVMVNGAATDKAWTSTSATSTIYGGDYVQLDGVKMTFGSSSDVNTTWTWNSSNTGTIPSQMPSTDGTAESLVTEFSAESPYGTLPTCGNFFKLEATESGLVTITCKPSTDAEQKLVFVEMDGDDMAAVTVNSSIWNSYYNYEVEAGKTYYIFQLAKSGNLSSYRYTMRGISFQKQILDEDANYTPADMVGITALTLKRTIGSGKWNTLVLPVALTEVQLKAAFGENVKVAALTSVDGGTLNFERVTATVANQPYMIYVENDFSEYTFTDVTVVDGAPTQTVGGVNFVGSYNALTDIPTGCYFASNNRLKIAGTGNTMKGTRAYFEVVSGEVHALNFVINEGEATGIVEVHSALNTQQFTILAVVVSRLFRRDSIS